MGQKPCAEKKGQQTAYTRLNMLQCIMCDCITVLNLNAVVHPVLRLCHFH